MIKLWKCQFTSPIKYENLLQHEKNLELMTKLDSHQPKDDYLKEKKRLFEGSSRSLSIMTNRTAWSR